VNPTIAQWQPLIIPYRLTWAFFGVSFFGLSTFLATNFGFTATLGFLGGLITSGLEEDALRFLADFLYEYDEEDDELDELEESEEDEEELDELLTEY